MGFSCNMQILGWYLQVGIFSNSRPHPFHYPSVVFERAIKQDFSSYFDTFILSWTRPSSLTHMFVTTRTLLFYINVWFSFLIVFAIVLVTKKWKRIFWALLVTFLYLNKFCFSGPTSSLQQAVMVTWSFGRS